MRPSIYRFTSLFILFLYALHSGQAFAGNRNASTSKAGKLQQAHIWYDGNQERQIWLDPTLLVEFDPVQGSIVGSAVRSLYTDAVPISKLHGAVRIWRLGSGTRSDAAARDLRKGNHSRNYSPILRDGPTSAGRMRALPGNIIVYLNPAWDSATVSSWAATHQLEIAKKLEIGPNIYIIKTGPGLEALNIANLLYQSGEVVAAFPDWWEEVATR